MRGSATSTDRLARVAGLHGADPHDLHAGTGRWTHTPAGAAARERSHARHNSTTCNEPLRTRTSDDENAAPLPIPSPPSPHPSTRPSAGWQQLGEPIAVQLHEQITTTRGDLERRHLAEAQQRLNRYLRSSLPEPSIDPGRDLGIGL